MACNVKQLNAGARRCCMSGSRQSESKVQEDSIASRVHEAVDGDEASR